MDYEPVKESDLHALLARMPSSKPGQHAMRL
jgi:hypothetical protein